MPKISVIANTSMGGTEKAATIYAAGLARRGWEVDYLARTGPRAPFLVENGVRLLDAASDPRTLREYVENARPAVIHQHVPGYPADNSLYPALEALPADFPRPKIIETNVFGRLEDPRNERFIDFRTFISAASAAQAFRRAGIRVSDRLFQRQTVVYYPVAPSTMLDALARQRFRDELGVAKEEVLAVRVGQPSHKWAAWEAEAFALALRFDPRTAARLRLFLMEPNAPLRRRVEAVRYGKGIILRPATTDFAWIARLYAAADLMIHASDWGESFGYTIAEGMAAGLPVITRSTPWCDNAQVELVRNGETGFVCRSVPEMARRLADLTRELDLRKKLGEAARERIMLLADANCEIELLEEVIVFALKGDRGTKLCDRTVAVEQFVKRFRELEKDTSERNVPFKLDQLQAGAFSTYRRVRSATRAFVNQLRQR